MNSELNTPACQVPPFIFFIIVSDLSPPPLSSWEKAGATWVKSGLSRSQDLAGLSSAVFLPSEWRD